MCMAQNDIPNAFKELIREWRSQCYAVELFGIPHLAYVCNDFFELARTSHWKMKAVQLCSLQNNIKNIIEL